MKKEGFLVRKLNRLSLKRKLMVLQIFCVILPLLLTDSVIMGIVVNAEKQTDLQEMENIAYSVKYTITDYSESSLALMQDLYANRELNEFINNAYESPLDYYSRHLEFTRASMFSDLIGNNRRTVIIYTDAPGIINGGSFQQLEKAKGESWYQEFVKQDKRVFLYTDFAKVNWEQKRTISLIRRLDYFGRDNRGNVLKLDWDYSGLSRTLLNAKYSYTVYVCAGNTVIFSNEGRGGLKAPFERIADTAVSAAGVHEAINICDNIWDIYVMPGENTVYAAVKKNLPLLLALVLLNILLPFGLMNLINRSFTERLQELDAAIGKVDKDEPYRLSEISGGDEISMLMKTYNEMAERMNNLIQNEYKNRLERQEHNIARQKAELLALRSQINPHFLFNVLESIRMHSVLRQEDETAEMVERLALILRQNVDWENDYVTVLDEIHFVKAYLELQKYRFGDKLKFVINADEECSRYRIPKLTLVTFVENACVHGMENKTSSVWVFVRVFADGEKLTLEVEDTGKGMSEEECSRMLQRMNEVDIEMLQEGGSVGVLNAALRLKMYSGGRVRFEIDSEAGAGTMVSIEIPLDAAEQKDQI